MIKILCFKRLKKPESFINVDKFIKFLLYRAYLLRGIVGQDINEITYLYRVYA